MVYTLDPQTIHTACQKSPLARTKATDEHSSRVVHATVMYRSLNIHHLEMPLAHTTLLLGTRQSGRLGVNSSLGLKMQATRNGGKVMKPPLHGETPLVGVIQDASDAR